MSKIKSSQFVIATLIAFSISLLIKVPKANAEDYYGAIAYAPFSRHMAVSKNYPTLQAAERAALEKCEETNSRDYFRTRDCKIVVSFQNGCGALAGSIGAYGVGLGEDRLTAQRNAINNCNSNSSTRGNYCRVRLWACTSH